MFAAHASCQKRFNKVLSFVVMSEDFLRLTTTLCMKYVCVHVFKTTNWQFIIVCNFIYIVVINCGWRMDGTVGGARDGAVMRWLSSSDVTFLQKSQWLMKKHSYFMQTVHFTVDWLFWNLYCSYISPRPQLSWKKPGNLSFDNMGPLMLKTVADWCLCGNWFIFHQDFLVNKKKRSFEYFVTL